jgi:hypothetical protein
MAYQQSTRQPAHKNRKSFLRTKMRNIVHRGTACIPSDVLSFWVKRNKIILPLGQRIVNLQRWQLNARQLLGLLPCGLSRGHEVSLVPNMNG